MAENEEKKSGKKVFVCSKLASDNAYTCYAKDATGGKQLPRALRVVLIHGKANVIDKKLLVTPQGVVTTITEDQLEDVRKFSAAFRRHEERGFLKILSRNPGQKEVDKIGGDMPLDTGSAQKVAEDFKNEPITNSDKE
jgi:hypothetical protein